jgi:hypothetical protein
MHKRTALPLALALTAALAMPLAGQGKGKGSDDNRGKGSRGDAPAARGNQGQDRGRDAQARSDNRGRGNDVDRGRAQADRGRGNDDRGRPAVPPGQARRDDDRGNRGAASAFGRARAAEVREAGGDVAGPARGGRFARAFDPDEVRPVVRGFAVSPKLSERIAGRAVALAFDRGVGDDLLIVQPVDNRVRVVNRDGLLLLELDEDRARRLGGWRVVTLRDDDDDDDDREGSPAFCRSGAGHPNWGRQWCIDKGFGLGVDRDIRWGRAIELEDVVLRRRVDQTDLTRDVLFDVLGDVVFNRLAAHALTLGLVDPLVGRWVVEPAGRRVLLVNAGPAPVAEVVDTNGDNRADVMLVALRPW